MRQKVLTPTARRMIVKTYSTGKLSLKDCARTYGFSVAKTRQVLRDAGVEIRGTRQKLTVDKNIAPVDSIYRRK